MKKILFTVTLLSIAQHAFTQGFVDNALLFSRNQPTGSARILALGGAQVSLGGDYSAALSNPAGLGMYNRSEVSFSLGFVNQLNNIQYGNTTSEEGVNKLSIPGFSYIQRQAYNDDKLISGAFAFTFSRTNNFNSRFSYEGDFDQSSLIDYFIDYANGNALTPQDLEGDYYYTLAGLGYGSYLLQDYDDNGFIAYGSALSPLPGETRTIRQREEVIRKGAQSQLSFSYGANYDDVLFFGATLGVATLRFQQNQFYSESNFRFSDDATYNPLRSFDLDENFDIQGSGVNFTIGTIFRPADFVQVGLSYATPTLYSLTDSYTARIDANWNNFDYFGDGQTILNNTFSEFDVPFISEYDLRTPAKFSAGASFISEYGFITADAEFINYGKAKYSSNIIGESYDQDNEMISNEYRNVVNLRVGAEFRQDIFRVRAGYNYQADPYQLNDNLDRTIHTISGGLGIRTAKFFVDFTMLQMNSEGRRSPYFVNGLDSPEAFLNIKNTHVIATVGFPF